MKYYTYLRPATGAGFAAAGMLLAWSMAPLIPAQETKTAPEGLGLKIVVLEGEDGVNIVKKKSAVRPVVEVRDKNDLPVAGASVAFLTPNSGASAVFHGTRSLTVLTDSAGRATVSGMRPVGTGRFTIQVRARFHGQAANASISQTNYVTVAAAGAAGAGGAAAGVAAGLSVGVIAGIAGGVAAAAAVGAAVALRKGSKGPPNNGITQGTIGLGGGPVIVAPH